MGIGTHNPPRVPRVGDEISLWDGDFDFRGHIVAVFVSRAHKKFKVVAENANGIIKVFNPSVLVQVDRSGNETRFYRYDK